jgi:hypothetical protein
MERTIIHDYASTDGGCDFYEQLYPTDFEVIPMLGSKVYVVNATGKEIYCFEIYAKGKDFFIPKGACAWKTEYHEIRFDEHGSRWFYGIENAKAKLSEYLTDEEEIIEGDEDCWYAARL